jgi:hypothetical protein
MGVGCAVSLPQHFPGQAGMKAADGVQGVDCGPGQSEETGLEWPELRFPGE